MICPDCKGSGRYIGFQWEGGDCLTCKGLGTVTDSAPPKRTMADEADEDNTPTGPARDTECGCFPGYVCTRCEANGGQVSDLGAGMGRGRITGACPPPPPGADVRYWSVIEGITLRPMQRGTIVFDPGKYNLRYLDADDLVMSAVFDDGSEASAFVLLETAAFMGVNHLVGTRPLSHLPEAGLDMSHTRIRLMPGGQTLLLEVVNLHNASEVRAWASIGGMGVKW